MVIHVVLYRPRPNLDKRVRAALLEAVSMARDEIPQIRRVVLGKRVVRAQPYRLGNMPDLPFAAVIEFTDRDGLEGYLAHPRHQELARLFNDSVEAGFIFDYDVADGATLASIGDD
jgi:hypothetical protein